MRTVLPRTGKLRVANGELWFVALEHLFQGSALNAVDAKGRVSVPAFLRSVIERRGDARTIVLAKHDNFACLSAYDPAYAALKHAKLERLLEKEETGPKDADSEPA